VYATHKKNNTQKKMQKMHTNIQKNAKQSLKKIIKHTKMQKQNHTKSAKQIKGIII